jgi:hypothetical protein
LITIFPYFYNGEIQKYEIVDGIAGAFEIDDRRQLKHLITRPVHYYERLNGKNVADAIREVQQIWR